MAMKPEVQILLAAVIAVAGCATERQEPVDEAAAELFAQFDRTGEEVNCLSVTRITSIKPVSEELFLVQTGVNDYYLNEVSGRCNGATRPSTRLQYSTSTGQVCRNEIIRVVDNTAGFQVGGCGFGVFEKLNKKPYAEEQ